MCIVTGREPTRLAVQKLADFVKLAEVDSWKSSDLEWFSCRHSVSNNSVSTLLFMNLQEPMDDVWPLCKLMEKELAQSFSVQRNPSVNEEVSMSVPSQSPAADSSEEAILDTEHGDKAIDSAADGSNNSVDSAAGDSDNSVDKSLDDKNLDEEDSRHPDDGILTDKEVSQDKVNPQSGDTTSTSNTPVAKKKSEKNGHPQPASRDLRKSQRLTEVASRGSEIIEVVAPKSNKSLSKKRARKEHQDPVSEPSVKRQPTQPPTVMWGPGSHFYYPIDVDDDVPMNSPNLETTKRKVLHPCRYFPCGSAYTIFKKLIQNDCQFTAYGPGGQSIDIVPTMHFQKDLEHFKTFIEAMKKCYVGGKPLYIACPELSVFKLMDKQDYDKMSISALQDIFRTQHIVLNNATSIIQFDKDGLSRLRSMRSTIVIQDQSIAVKQDYSVRLRDGTLQDLIDAGNDPGKKILNALSFPMGWIGWNDLRHACELNAWRATEGMQFAKEDRDIPMKDYQFGLAATKGAHHWWHIDGPFATSLSVKSGGKYVFVWRPTFNGRPLTPQNLDNFATSKLFSSSSFELEKGTHEYWDVEGIYLPAGSQLLMRPNTLHCVYTTENAIVHGSHFFSTHVMKDTIHAIIHTFVCPNLIANSTHPGSRLMLQRIIMFYYRGFVENAIEEDDVEWIDLPDLTNFENIINFFSLCNFGILINVLDHRTYTEPRGNNARLMHVQFDANGISYRERRFFVYIRRLSFELLTWFCTAYEVHHAASGRVDPMTSLILPFLLWQANGILTYKGIFQDNNNPSDNPSLEDVQMQLAACLYLFPCIDFRPELKTETFGWPFERNITCTKCANPKPRVDISQCWGLTSRDKLFFGFADGNPTEENALPADHTTKDTLSDSNAEEENPRASKKRKV